MEIVTLEVAGIESAISSMRNPMDSWKYKDTKGTVIGEKDLTLARKLVKSGNEHMKFMRMIQVWANFNMTRYFWSEFDTYKFNSKNSCSTMHKLLNPEYEICVGMFEYYKEDEDVVTVVVNRLNEIRKKYLESTDAEEKRILKRRAKTLLFEGYLQLRTVNTNYAEIRNIVSQRKNHQLKEDWQDNFCKWATTLPYAKELIFHGMEEYYYKFKLGEGIEW